VRYFAAGRVHDVGLVTLDSGQTAYVAGGAVVRGGFRARGGGGVRIVGRGVVDASGLERGARMIELVGVRDARVEGVTLVNSGGWTVVPVRADGFVARDLKILNWRTGSDGIDLVATSHAVVEDSFVRANDDCVAVKTWGGDPGYPEGRAERGPDVADITVRNSTFWNMPWGNAIEIGFELRAGAVRDLRFLNSDIIHVERGAALSIHQGDDAEVRGVLFEDIRVEDARHKLVDLAVVYSQYSVDRPADPEERRRLYMNGAWDGVLACRRAPRASTRATAGASATSRCAASRWSTGRCRSR
jgi:polygalacturonase